MNALGLAQLGLYVALLLVATKPLGIYIYTIMQGIPTLPSRILGPVERGLYRAARC